MRIVFVNKNVREHGVVKNEQLGLFKEMKNERFFYWTNKCLEQTFLKTIGFLLNKRFFTTNF